MRAIVDRNRGAWAGAILVLLAAATAPASDRPPNVVLILADDLGWSDLGCYGADLHESPRIDRFATEGVRFTAAYAAPVCSPTRAALMTGKHPARLRMTIWYEASADPPRNRPLVPPVTVGNLPHAEVTIAEALREAGYRTAHIGKWHLGDAAHYPETQGFDLNVGGTFWGAPSTHFFPFRGFWGNGDEYRYVPGLGWGEPGDYLSDRLTDAALEVIDRADDRPFFLYLAYHAVHTPIEAPDGLVEKYRGKLAPGLHHRNSTYAAMVERLDANVGRVLDRIDERGLANETVVVFLSDNGGYINDYRGEAVTTNHPLRSGKGSLYEGGVRVPLIVRRPGEPAAGSVVETPVTVMDLYPTILDLAGLDAGRPPDGQSLLPLLDGEAPADRGPLYWHYPHYYPTTTPVGAIRDGDWKLLEYFEDDHVELYDLAADPGERDDLGTSRPEVADRLRGRLREWRREVDAQMPEPADRAPGR